MSFAFLLIYEDLIRLLLIPMKYNRHEMSINRFTLHSNSMNYLLFLEFSKLYNLTQNYSETAFLMTDKIN